MQLEHIGIAVRDLASALDTIELLLGKRPYKSETVESEGVRTHFIHGGGPKLEMLEALGDESPLARHIEKRGAGLHHLAFEVDDLEETHRRLSEAGFRVLGKPRPGADGKQIFFVHPQDTAGILFEFCRQTQSTLEDLELTAGGERFLVRRSNTNGLPVLVLRGLPLSESLLARHLEQIAEVIVVEENSAAAIAETLVPGGFHLVLPASRLDAAISIGHARSVVVFVDVPTDMPLPDTPLLIAALPPMAAAATALYERSPDAGLAVAEDDLIAVAIRRHVDR